MSLHDAIEAGDLAALQQLISEGADVNLPGHCWATPLMTAIQYRSLAALTELLGADADPEITDQFNHTALRHAVSSDWPEAVTILIQRGVDLGRHPKYPLKPRAYSSSQIMADLPMPDVIKEFVSADQWRKMNEETMAWLDASGANPKPEPIILDASSVEVVKLLVDAGENIADAPREVVRQFVGLAQEASLSVSADDFNRDRHPRFGTAHPELVDSPFWRDMIRCGKRAYHARQAFGYEDYDEPVWCYDRFGHSMTALGDGRFVGIAGEHEDYYDPDFHIYNDVIVHDGNGGIAIYAYPHDVFPPTDFHSATLVDSGIIIIGNLGYPKYRRAGATPVYRLDLETFSIEPISATGPAPGWISRHRAQYDAARGMIQITDGEVWTELPDGTGTLTPFAGKSCLDVKSMTWLENCSGPGKL